MHGLSVRAGNSARGYKGLWANWSPAEGRKIIEAVRSLSDGKVIATTNYDTLIEDLSPNSQWRSITWNDDNYR